ncbi:MAG TPA: MarR family transcriptional regulator [Burkholderiaceae bacterium]|jgi:DNA-binding MarR family transcriptional regulator|nr:MarR family transcriptional regulator [Burkholderiaceae bacterium]
MGRLTKTTVATASALCAPRRLEDLFNYRLFQLQALASAPVRRLLEGRFGITRREWRVLALLATHGALSPSELALRAHLDRPRTSRALQALVRKSLAQRAPLAADARRATASLTERGMALYEEVFPAIAQINARLVAVLDPTSLNALDQMLERLTEHARRLDAELARDVRADRRHGGSRRMLPR